MPIYRQLVGRATVGLLTIVMAAACGASIVPIRPNSRVCSGSC